MNFIDELLKDEKVEWKTIGDIIERYSEKGKKDKNVKIVYSVSKDYGIISSLEYWEKTASSQRATYQMYSENTDNYNIIRKNMFAYNPARLNIGSISYLFNEEPGLLSPMYIIFKINEKLVTPKYLLIFLKSTKILKKIDSMKEIGARFRFDFDNWKKIKIPLPSLETQEKIVKILDSYKEYITELQEKLKIELQARNKQYNYYRDMLLSEDYLNKISKKLDSLNYVLRLTTLGEIGKFTRGNGLQKKDFREKGKPVIHYGQIYTQYGFSTDKTISFAEENIFSKLRKAKPNDILIATTSENIEDVAKSTVWLGNEEVGFSGDMYSYSTNENSKYIAYYFQTAGFQKQKERKVTGTKLIRIHGEDMEKFTISLPPIEIQNKIVKILDRFQELLSDTKGLLPLEIEQRRKQYEYYREKLLTFDEGEGYALSTAQHSTAQHSTAQRQITSKFFELLKEAAKVVSIDINDKVEWKTLSEVAKYSKDRISFEYLNEKNYVGVENLLKNRLGKIDSNNVPTEGNSVKFNMGDILIGNIRPYLRKIWLADIEGGTNGDVLVISIDKKHKNKILSRYLYQILSDEKFFDYNIKYSKGAKMPRGDKEKIMEYKIPLPPLPVQEYIVSILDKFDALVNDLSQGLPREIELRQKQYEYYREKLLNFEK